MQNYNMTKVYRKHHFLTIFNADEVSDVTLNLLSVRRPTTQMMLPEASQTTSCRRFSNISHFMSVR